jgi:hypothetical protein
VFTTPPVFTPSTNGTTCTTTDRRTGACTSTGCDTDLCGSGVACTGTFGRCGSGGGPI